jgi:hypothetical protein
MATRCGGVHGPGDDEALDLRSPLERGVDPEGPSVGYGSVLGVMCCQGVASACGAPYRRVVGQEIGPDLRIRLVSLGATLILGGLLQPARPNGPREATSAVRMASVLVRGDRVAAMIDHVGHPR